MKKNWLTKLICGVLACSCALSIASCKDPVSSEKELLPTGEEKEVVKDVKKRTLNAAALTFVLLLTIQ